MGNTTTALVLVLILNLFMFIFQASLLNVNPDYNKAYDYKGSLFEGFNKGNQTEPSLDVEKYAEEGTLPSAQPTVTNTGNLFVDVFNSVKSWFQSTIGNNYFVAMLRTPYDLLMAIHLPTALAYALGTFWYALTLFVILSFWWGKDY